ncbi:MAG: hypothetical protein JNL88_03195 [Bacteroidia bacterium]|nr:hypothetical protein [Bacteroidia bacterium]
MRKFLVVVFSIYFLAGHVFLLQVLRTPQLYDHFYRHRQDQAIGLLQFLDQHYNRCADGDQDEAEDRSLPFKSAVSSPGPHTGFGFLKAASPDLFVGSCGDLLTVHVIQQEGREVPASIFQPPRPTTGLLS